jgi:hypothetical protein
MDNFKEIGFDLWTGSRWFRIGSSDQAPVSKVVNSVVPQNSAKSSKKPA